MEKIVKGNFTNNYWSRIICLFVVVAITTGVGRLEAQVLTLEEAINLALQRNLDLKIARTNLEISQENNHISIAGGIPTVTGGLTDNQSITNLTQNLTNGTKIERKGNIQNQLNANITGSYLLFNGYRVMATRQRLQSLERLSQQQVNAQIQNVIADVMVRYYNIIRQQGFMETIRQSIAVTRQRKELMDVRQSVGMANNADTYQAQLDLTASQQDLRTQELILQQAKADLLNVLALSADTTVILSDTIVVDTTIQVGQVVEGLQKNPELLIAEEQIRVNEFLTREVNAARYPALLLNGGYNYSRTQSTAGFTLLNRNVGPFVGINLQVPIFNGGANRRRTRIAEMETRSAEIARDAVMNDLETLAVKAWQAYNNNIERLRIEQENNRIAAALLEVVSKRFELGVGTVIDLREAQRSFVEAGYRLVNVAYEAKVAEIELKRISRQLVF